MIRNKYIILPFLLTAWTIIFVHSIIPHHHHSEDIFSEGNQCDVHGFHLSDSKEFHDCDLDCNNFTCHFQVKILSQVTIDNIFIVDAENSTDNYVCFSKTNTLDYYSYFISDQFQKTKYLRGPPQLTIFYS